MELFICTALTITMWVLSMTLLLPFILCLKFSKTVRNQYFSWIFVRVITPLMEQMEKMRKPAFDRLKEQLGDRKRNTPLEVLEVGIGSGFNLPYYPENVNLTTVDMSESFIKYFEKNRQKYPKINFKRAVIGMAEDMREIGDDIFDAVICSYTLCSVQNVRSVLDEIKRVLKPGGKFLCLEHVIYPKSTWASTLQRFASPLWSIYCNGCTLSRSTDEEIRKTGFSDVTIEKHHPKDMWLVVRSQIIAIASK